MEQLRVLIVDDELGMRKGAARVLGKHQVTLPQFNGEYGFLTEEAEDGKSALEKLDATPWDIMLLDYKLPDLSGLEILDSIREKKVDVMTIMITAYASLEVAVSATKNGAFDFLAKPFTPDELKSVIDKASQSLLALRRARDLEREKRRVRFQFISVLAHELKSPLAAIESYLQLMEKHVAGNDISKYDHILNRSLIRIEGMRKMIFDLLDLTRIESGQKKRELSRINIIDAVNTSIENVSVAAAERDISVRLQAPEELTLNADRSEIEIIFNNLISNAVKYNKDGGTVDIHLSKQDHVVHIEVKDSGIGMSEVEVKRLFGEFVRIKNEKTKNILGSGLGLSILKKLTDYYNGSIAVESKPDVGSTFRVTLHDANDNTAYIKEN